MKWDVGNPQDRAILMAARSWGVSPSTFMGEPKPCTTGYTYDTQGRLALSTESRAPAWTENDSQAALDLQEYEADLCPGCNHPLAETTDPQNELRYRADLPVRCHRCTASAVASEYYTESPQSHALFIPIILTREET